MRARRSPTRLGAVTQFSAPAASAPASPRQPSVALEVAVPLLLGLVSLWIGIGRAFFGSTGWLMLIFFTLLPFAIIYVVVIGLMLRSMVMRYHYRLHGWLLTSSIALIVSGVLYGFTLVDFGDTSDSAGSVLTRLFGATYVYDNVPFIFEVSNVLALITGLLTAFLAISLFVQMAVVSTQLSRSHRPPPPPPPPGWPAAPGTPAGYGLR
jgi:hypothetical protein